MKLIIDISEELYARVPTLINTGNIWIGDVLEAVKNGTPLESQPSEDCISREAVLDYAKDTCLDLDKYEDTEVFCDEIKALPSVTPTSEDIKEAYLKGYEFGVKDWFKSKTQPCEDAVSREAVIENVIKCTDMNEDTMEVLENKVKALPPVTPKYTDEEIDKAQAVEQAYVDKMVELAVEETKRLSADYISNYIKQKIDYLEDLASIETNEGRWRDEEKYLYAVSVLEEVVEYMNTIGGEEDGVSN